LGFILFLHLIIFFATCYFLYKLITDKKATKACLFAIILLFLISLFSPAGNILGGLPEEQKTAFIKEKQAGTNVITGPV